MDISSLMGIAAYILLSLGMQTIAKRRGIKNPWLAWIPVANMWLLGCISDQYRYVAHNQEKSKRKLMLTLSIISAALAVVLVIVILVWGMGLAMEMGFMDMTEAQLTELAGMSDEALAEEITETVLAKMRADAAFFEAAMEMALVLGAFGLVAGVVGIWLAILEYMAYYDLFMSTSPKNATVYLLLGIFLGGFAGIVWGLLVFLIREKDEGMPPRQEVVVEQPVYQPAAEQPVYQPVVDAEDATTVEDDSQ